MSLFSSLTNRIFVATAALAVGDAIRVGDLTLPSGVTTEVDPEDPVVTASIVQQDVPEAEPGGKQQNARLSWGRARMSLGGFETRVGTNGPRLPRRNVDAHAAFRCRARPGTAETRCRLNVRLSTGVP